MNLNTVHTKEQLDQLLICTDNSNLYHILFVRGDGEPLVPKLNSEEIGCVKALAHPLF